MSKYGVFLLCIFLYSDFKYIDLWSKSPYSVRIREKIDQKKLPIWRLFTQCLSKKIQNLLPITSKIFHIYNFYNSFFLAYIAAILAVITYMIICVGSVFLVYSLMNDSNSKHLNNALTMLAVGTLIGDAMLHLLPKVSIY